MTFGSEAAARYNMFITNGVLGSNYYGLASVNYGGTVVAGVWTHVALARSGSTVKGYLNGTVLGTTETNSSAIGNNGPLRIASDSGGTGVFSGYFADLRITRGLARYTTTFTVPAAPLFLK
jgi:hypothetical protein